MSKKLLILHPCHFEQLMGGAELQIKYLIRFAKARNWEVHYIYVDFMHGERIVNADGIRLHPLAKRFGDFYFNYYFDIKNLLESIGPDVIYTRSNNAMIYFASQYARKNRKRHIYAVPSDRDVGKKYYFSRCPFRQLESLLLRRGVRTADGYLLQNSFQHSVLNRFNPNNILVKQMTPQCECSYHEKSPAVKVLWVGNLKPIKQPELFLELAVRMAGTPRPYELLMVGRENSVYRGLIDDAARANPAFRFLGELPQDEVCRQMASSHVLINTSTLEGFPNTFVQAWMRKMVVLSVNANPSNVVTDNGLGFMAPTVDALRDRLVYLLERPDELERIGTRAWEYAMDNHSLEKNMPRAFAFITGESCGDPHAAPDTAAGAHNE